MRTAHRVMAARYQHVLESIRKGVTDQVGGLFRGTDDDPADGTDDSQRARPTREAP